MHYRVTRDREGDVSVVATDDRRENSLEETSGPSCSGGAKTGDRIEDRQQHTTGRDGATRTCGQQQTTTTTIRPLNGGVGRSRRVSWGRISCQRHSGRG
ncbi:hypothetical protein NHX12_020661 [Muraenolepis orangiensis]|uniref:Uncharacterized protein n=1 Tax=Muraenolepis orangiensis TaxID=630683 RepID=A0A9Q0IW10_9TELE|nr:hypothetical protein NHX12_020661 [Muraenolepis orangiensis]